MALATEQLVRMSDDEKLSLLERQLDQVNFPLAFDPDLEEAKRVIAFWRGQRALAKQTGANA